jgi:2-oxoglutarate/2-oxoacid ferredoxin oxidoreductase subunit alpha
MIEFLEGNDAVVRGAIDAGCGFFAGYPITPASSILTGMMRELPAAGGVCIQGEDEIASIGMCIGAAMTGLKAMTATSGPGLSLYSENIGLALMGETPLVIVNVQRQGPATGSATKGADGDIEFMRWVTSGGLPMIVLSPENVFECYTLTRMAFNLAERFRCPVLLASQKEVGLTREVFDYEAAQAAAPPVLSRPVAPVDCVYEPHACTLPDAVAPMSPIGGPHLVRYTTSTHDQRAYLAKDPDLIARMLAHYEHKVADHAEEIALLDANLEEGADTLILTYGVVARSAKEAVRSLRREGKRVSLLTLKTLFPLPEAAIRAAAAAHTRVLVPEMNLGQYVREIECLLPGKEVISIAKMNTELLSPTEIIRKGGLA